MAACSSTCFGSFIVHMLKYSYSYVLINVLMISICMALYEDQVGLFDWRQQYIGKPQDMYFEQLSQSSRRAFVSTEANVLAALNTRTGGIAWRSVFETSHGSIESLLHDSKLLVTVSSNARIIRSWDPSRGHLLWETNVHSDILRTGRSLLKPKAILLDSDNGGLIVMSSRAVKMLSQNDGSEIWEYTLSNDVDASAINEGIYLNAGLLTLLVSRDEKFLIKRDIDLESGKMTSEIIFSMPWNLNSQVICDIVGQKYLACLDKSMKIVHVLRNMESQSAVYFHSVSLGDLHNDLRMESRQLELYSLSKAPANAHFVVSTESVKFIVKISGDSSIKVEEKLTGNGILLDAGLSSKSYVYYVSSDDAFINVVAYELEKNALIRVPSLDMAVPLGGNAHGSPIKGTVFMYLKNSDVGYRILLGNEDHCLCLIQHVGGSNGKILWEREEALATTALSEMIELPPATSASKLELLHAAFSVPPNAGIFTMFLNRIKSQIRQFQVFTQGLKKQPHMPESVVGASTATEKVDALTRDQFNIHKIILMMTKAKKMFAVNSRNGDIVWSKFMPTIYPFLGLLEKQYYLAQQRTTAHFPLPPQCILIGAYRAGEEPGHSRAVVYTFNPLNGAGLNEPVHITDYKVLQVSELPFEDAKSAKVVAIVDSDLKLHVYPETDDTLGQFRERRASIYVYLVNPASNMLQGHIVDGGFELVPVWSLNIPETQKIVRVSAKRRGETVDSVGRVLGDHSVLYKYLNPNVIAVATIQEPGAKGSVFVYVIDAVTGNVLYHARHKGATAPLHLILSEHWLLYVLYNEKARRNELSVVEFYEGDEEKNNTAFSSLDPVDTPMVLSQGYVLHASGIRTMSMTNTDRGITSKSILFGLESGYVMSIPKNFLDPRRSFDQTPILQEEGLPPYMPEIPMMPQGFVNYNVTLHQIRSIDTAAAGLESTSLVLAYGLDVFYTRVTPSKMFDVLKEDFDYILISAVLSALILASIICSKLASIRALNLAWK